MEQIKGGPYLQLPTAFQLSTDKQTQAKREWLNSFLDASLDSAIVGSKTAGELGQAAAHASLVKGQTFPDERYIKIPVQLTQVKRRSVFSKDRRRTRPVLLKQ